MAEFDPLENDCLLIDENGRDMTLAAETVESLYTEIGDVEARRLVDEAGRHGWEKSPSKPIAKPDPIKFEIVGDPVAVIPKRKRGRPRKERKNYAAII